jgi:hypothetical protein
MMEKKPPTKPGNLVQTIERVSLILEMVGRNPRGMSVRDLSAGLNLPKGTVHRLLSSLSYFGYIRQDGATKNYFLGLKLMELGAYLSARSTSGRSPSRSSGSWWSGRSRPPTWSSTTVTRWSTWRRSRPGSRRAA